MKSNRVTVVLSAIFLVGLVFSANLKDRVLASPKAHVKKSPGKDPSVVGQWGAPISLGMVPIHAALLPDSQVLFWEYLNPTNQNPGTVAVLFNPVTQTVTSIPTAPTADFFCSGATHLSNGEVLIDGGLAGPLHHGDNGSSNVTIFDPTTNTFAQQANMAYPRYYPTNISMPDGTQLVVSGQDATDKIVNPLESWNPIMNSWTTLPAAANLPAWSEPWNNYPRAFLLPSGNLYVANQLYHTWFFNPTTYAWTFIGQYNDVNRYRAAQVLMPDLATVMVMGGQADKGLPTNTMETINLSSSTPAWTYGTPMATARHDLNAVQLPDGTILGVGGASGAGNYTDPVYAAELYTPPATQVGLGTWTTLASQLGSRAYHSVALLLPNGTVLSAGSDSNTQYQTYAEIFSPPYLFKGGRPVISSAPGVIEYGQSFTVSMTNPVAIGSVALIRLDALTHANHMDQRMLNLTFTPGDNNLQVTSPANANYAPPGYYMVFLVSNAGVPSVAKIVELSTATAGATKPDTARPNKK
jgi:hypothetical protein